MLSNHPIQQLLRTVSKYCIFLLVPVSLIQADDGGVVVRCASSKALIEKQIDRKFHVPLTGLQAFCGLLLGCTCNTLELADLLLLRSAELSFAHPSQTEV